MNALQRFGDRDFAVGVPPPSAFTLTSEPAAEPCLAGSQPSMPCRIRSAFFDGVMVGSGLGIWILVTVPRKSRARHLPCAGERDGNK